MENKFWFYSYARLDDDGRLISISNDVSKYHPFEKQKDYDEIVISYKEITEQEYDLFNRLALR
jgi:hypothetical protein